MKKQDRELYSYLAKNKKTRDRLHRLIRDHGPEKLVELIKKWEVSHG